MFQAATAEDLTAIEAFCRERGAPVFHEVSPLADATLVAQLSERGYHPFEFTSVLYRPIARDAGLKACTTPEELDAGLKTCTTPEGKAGTTSESTATEVVQAFRPAGVHGHEMETLMADPVPAVGSRQSRIDSVIVRRR